MRPIILALPLALLAACAAGPSVYFPSGTGPDDADRSLERSRWQRLEQREFMRDADRQYEWVQEQGKQEIIRIPR